MSQGLPLREDVPVSETWDLVDLFKDDQQYYESIDALVQTSKSISSYICNNIKFNRTN